MGAVVVAVEEVAAWTLPVVRSIACFAAFVVGLGVAEVLGPERGLEGTAAGCILVEAPAGVVEWVDSSR